MIKTFLETKRYNKSDNDYFWFRNDGYKDIYFQIYGSFEGTQEFSYDKSTWYDKDYNDGWWTIILKPGQKVYFRSTDGWSGENGIQYTEYEIGRLSVGGPVASLVDYTDMANVTALPDHCLHNLFGGGNGSSDGYFAENIYDASEMDFGNITTVGRYSLYGMFHNCKNIYTDKLPDFSGITEVGYNGMWNIFENCEKLQKGIDLSSVTTLDTNSLYNMYFGCHYLEEATFPNISVYDQSKTFNWLFDAGIDVTGTKIVNCPTGVVIPTGDNSGIPYGWTRVDY